MLAPATATAGDHAVLRAATLVPRVSHAAALARGGDPVAVQARYDAARDLEEALAVALPAGPACARLADVLGAYARAEAEAAEGFDRQSPGQVARATRVADRALARAGGARTACAGAPGAPVVAHQPGRIADPASFEAFFGAVRARAPVRAVGASISFGARHDVARAVVEGGWVRTRISAPSARGRLTVTFVDASGEVVGRSESRAVWLLPRNAAIASAKVRDDARLDAALARAASTFPGISAVFTRDLATGAQASWNDTARFPAASTVKLGVLAAALRRLGPHPEEQASFSDLEALAGWSSNLAANRLARRIGGAEVAQAELRRLGAGSSTYRGNYIVGTAVPRAPPAVSATVTTARDLANALTTLQRAAIGDRAARASSGLSVHDARVALGLLLASQPAGDNIGLLRPALGSALPMAQKQGWLHDARLTAAIVYTARGPRVVVICAYEPGLSRASAQLLGRRVASALALR